MELQGYAAQILLSYIRRCSFLWMLAQEINVISLFMFLKLFPFRRETFSGEFATFSRICETAIDFWLSACGTLFTC